MMEALGRQGWLGKMTPQAVGAYGEKMVEAALLRRGWIPSNVNASVKNAAKFDIVAQGPEGQLIPIRVKTCGPGKDAFVYGFKPGKVPTDDLGAIDFTVLVAMGTEAAADRFFIVPTRIVREALEAGRMAFYNRLRKDGNPRIETGQIALWLRPLRGPDDGQHDFARKWQGFRDWDLLSAANPERLCSLTASQLEQLVPGDPAVEVVTPEGNIPWHDYVKCKTGEVAAFHKKGRAG